MDAAFLWVILGGFLEPVWVVGLKRFNDTHKPGWGIFAVIFAILSPVFLGLGMGSMPLGVAYAIWTGIGAVFTLVVGFFLYKEKIGALKLVCVGLILAGVVGLNLVTGGARWIRHGFGSWQADLPR